MKIDFVVTWVDPSDKEWLKKKRSFEKAQGVGTDITTTDNRDVRYRDYGFFKYFFRCIEKNAPWVHRIFLVTDGQIPDFMRASHPKLKVIDHRDFIPEEYLPTFNSSPIELNLHRIPGLSEHFVYFNDDMFLTDAAEPEDFFVEGKPLDMFALQPVVANPDNPVMTRVLQNEALILSKHFDKRSYILHNIPGVFKPGYPVKNFVYNALELAFPRFTGFYNVHGPMNLCKSTFEKLWNLEGEALSATCSNKFRSDSDVPIYVFKDYQKLTGNYHPVNMERDFGYYELSDSNRRLCHDIRKHTHKFICINDPNRDFNVKKARKQVIKAFQSAYPEKSSLEK